MDTTVGLPRKGRADSVNDTHTKSSPLQAVPQRHDRISSLATLAQKHADIVPEDRGLAIQKVAGKLNANRDLRQLLKDRPSRQARVVTRTTSAEHNPPAATHDREVGAQPAKCDLVGVKVHPSTHGVDDRFGLLVDLLLHESIEFALHDRGNLKLERLDAPRGGDLAGGLVAFFLTAETVDVEFTLGDVGDVVVFEIEDAFSVLDYGGGVRGNEELDGLWETILGHEGTGLGAEDFRVDAWGSKQRGGG